MWTTNKDTPYKYPIITELGKSWLRKLLEERENFKCPYLNKTDIDTYPYQLPCSGCCQPKCPKQTIAIC